LEVLVNLRRNLAFALALVLNLGQSACQRPTVRGTPSEKTKILLDSPEVANLIRTGEKLHKQVLHEYLSVPLVTPDDLVRHDRIARRNPQHDTLVAKMSGLPGFEVAGGTPVEILLESSCGCDKAVLSTVYYVKIRTMDGPDKPMEGWTCRLALNDPRTGWP
jgi:hypothetical protein